VKRLVAGLSKIHPSERRRRYRKRKRIRDAQAVKMVRAMERAMRGVLPDDPEEKG